MAEIYSFNNKEINPAKENLKKSGKYVPNAMIDLSGMAYNTSSNNNSKSSTNHDYSSNDYYVNSVFKYNKSKEKNNIKEVTTYGGYYTFEDLKNLNPSNLDMKETSHIERENSMDPRKTFYNRLINNLKLDEKQILPEHTKIRERDL